MADARKDGQALKDHNRALEENIVNKNRCRQLEAGIQQGAISAESQGMGQLKQRLEAAIEAINIEMGNLQDATAKHTQATANAKVARSISVGRKVRGNRSWSQG